MPAHERKTVVYVTHAIEEAVFLADRAVVMTSYPGRIKEVLQIDLPRPRLASIRLEPRFQELAQHIWDLIRDAALSRNLGLELFNENNLGHGSSMTVPANSIYRRRAGADLQTQRGGNRHVP